MKGFTDINWLFYKYYRDHPDLKRIVVIHSEQVAKKALKICKDRKLSLDPTDVYCAAMLHDIGVVKCSAPDIHARGTLPYIQHGHEGEKILLKNGLSKYARICITHTGAGLTKQEIKDKGLHLPPIDMLPKTLLEKLICYADKFYSKSHDLRKEKSLEEVKAQMKKYGEDSYNRFMKLHQLFGEEN